MTFKPGAVTLDLLQADLRYGRATAEETIERLRGARLAFKSIMDFSEYDTEIRDAIGREIDAADFLIAMLQETK